MTVNPLHKLMNPKSVAFMGASNNVTRMGTFLLLNTLAGKYQGKIYPIHPKEEVILGLKAYKTISDLPEPAELLVLCIPTTLVPDVLEEAGRKGINRAIIVTAGYDEVSTAEGKNLQNQINDIVKKYGIRYVGPNCIGIYNGYASLNTTVFPNVMRPGRVGMISHSGTYLSHIFAYMDSLQFNFGEGLSLGNAASIDSVDTLEYFEERDDINTIAIYMEGLRRPKLFFEAAKRISRKKPIIALYVGGTEEGGRAVGTHTAAMTGNEVIYDAMFKQAGITRAFTIEELIDYAWAFSTQPLPKGNRMAIVSVSGGPSSSMADMIPRCGLRLPQFSDKLQTAIKKYLPHTGSAVNPVDITFSMDHNNFYRNIPELVLESDEVDGVFVYGIFGAEWIINLDKMVDAEVLNVSSELLLSVGKAEGVSFAAHLKSFNKPVLGGTFQTNLDKTIEEVRKGGVPLYTSSERAVKAMAAMYKYKTFLDRSAGRKS